MSSVGDFLREKMGNMSRWVKEELGNTGMDVEHITAEWTDTEIAYIVGVLESNSTKIAHRDWSGLAKVSNLPDELLELFQMIRKREDMHDKFWRYMELFVEVISNKP